MIFLDIEANLDESCIENPERFEKLEYTIVDKTFLMQFAKISKSGMYTVKEMRAE